MLPMDGLRDDLYGNIINDTGYVVDLLNVARHHMSAKYVRNTGKSETICSSQKKNRSISQNNSNMF